MRKIGTRGSGFTKQTVYSDLSFEDWEQIQSGPSSNFFVWLDHTERSARSEASKLQAGAVTEQAGLWDGQEQDRAYYLGLVLCRIRLLRQDLVDCNIEQALADALYLGADLRESELKSPSDRYLKSAMAAL